MIGMIFVGRADEWTRGADDARNLARLVCKMTRAGIQLTINSELNTGEIDHFCKRATEIAS